MKSRRRIPPSILLARSVSKVSRCLAITLALSSRTNDEKFSQISIRSILNPVHSINYFPLRMHLNDLTWTGRCATPAAMSVARWNEPVLDNEVDDRRPRSTIRSSSPIRPAAGSRCLFVSSTTISLSSWSIGDPVASLARLFYNWSHRFGDLVVLFVARRFCPVSSVNRFVATRFLANNSRRNRKSTPRPRRSLLPVPSARRFFSFLLLLLLRFLTLNYGSRAPSSPAPFGSVVASSYSRLTCFSNVFVNLHAPVSSLVLGYVAKDTWRAPEERPSPRRRSSTRVRLSRCSSSRSPFGKKKV